MPRRPSAARAEVDNSLSLAGEFCLRDVTDLRTGGLVTQTYNGRKFLKTPAAQKRWRIQFLEELASPGSASPQPSREQSGLTGRLASLLSSRRLFARWARTTAPRRESSELFFHIDGFDDSAAGVSIFGWAFLPGDPGDAVQLTLDSDRNSYVVDCTKMTRPDVNVAFPESPPKAGFQAFIDKRSFAAGVYRVGLLLRSHGQGPLFRLTDRRVRVSPSS